MKNGENIDYGKINNINTEYEGVDRIGDYGKDKDGFLFCYTKDGWKPADINAYEAHYWKKLANNYLETIKNKT